MMDERVLKWITCFCFVLTFVVCGSLFVFPQLHEQQVLAEENWNNQAQRPKTPQADVISQRPEDIVETTDEMEDDRLQIELPEGVGREQLAIENEYLSQTIYIRVPSDEKDYFSRFKVRGSCDHIREISYYREGENGVIALALDKVYELAEEYAEGKLFLEFINPHALYDKVLVVDAGHGGRASGATKLGIEEKNIDLAIVLELKAILEERAENVRVYYTRLDDSNPSLDDRVQLANKAEADLFISIHNNSTNDGRFSGVNGTQVLYNEMEEAGLSRRLAEICLEQVSDMISSRKVGLLRGNQIYIIRTSEVPVALIEVGFMTNREELNKLNTQEYQKLAAEGVYAAILKAFEEGY